MPTENYDIIISGSGMAGLSLVYRALKEGIWKNESILIIDKDRKTENDRTWCFWQQGEQSPFEEVIFRSWNELLFYTNKNECIRINSGKYSYNMIRSADFYKYTIEFISQFANVKFFVGNINSIEHTDTHGIVKTDQAVFKARYVFNSTYIKPDLRNSEQYFLQHFKGLRIRTSQFGGSPAEMHLMDFRTSQEHGTTFFYVLPISEDEVFLEYTIFSKSLLEQQEYDQKIREYLSGIMHIDDYEILESEFGVIPMTDFSFKRRLGNIMNIGVAGGDTRGSSGYTFTNTQKTISKILESYRQNKHPFFKTESINNKHKLLDATILRVLAKRDYEGHEIFSDLFLNVEGKDVFAFLDSESNVLQDLKIMSSLKAKYFIGPFLSVLADRIK